MADSPAHKLGQIIGDMLEALLRPPLERVAARHGLYLDYKHKREARGDKKKVAWTDAKGNVHDLDYVLEDGGSEKVVGVPRAFIESAWRRYTKHSRNKAQEIQGAVTPLASRYHASSPFLGVALAGVFTEGSLRQLRSHGFSVLFFPYKSVVDAFATQGVDVSFDEDTSVKKLAEKVAAYEALDKDKKAAVEEALRVLHSADIAAFEADLDASLTRKIERVIVLPLHGTRFEAATVKQAIDYVQSYGEANSSKSFSRYEVQVRYNNGDKIEGSFESKVDAVAFLSGFGVA